MLFWWEILYDCSNLQILLIGGKLYPWIILKCSDCRDVSLDMNTSHGIPCTKFHDGVLNITTMSIAMSCFIDLNEVQSFETEIPKSGPSLHRWLNELYLSMHSLACMRPEMDGSPFEKAWEAMIWRWLSHLQAWQHHGCMHGTIVCPKTSTMRLGGLKVKAINAMLYSQIICVGRTTPCHKVCGCLLVRFFMFSNFFHQLNKMCVVLANLQ